MTDGGGRAALRPERVMLLAGGDEASLSAAGWVARRARQRPIEVALVAVDAGAVHADGVRRIRAHLHGIAPDVGTLVQQIPGAPAHAFVEAASRQDLLVIGTDAVAPSTQGLWPTQAVRLIEAAQGAVVLVPRGWSEGAGPVVAGASGDGTDAAALPFAAAEAAALDRGLHLVHVWRPTSGLRDPVDASTERADHRARLDRIAERLRHDHPGLEVTTSLVLGEAPAEMVDAGSGAELVVVGAHGWAPVDRVLLRSVGRALVERPPCPVAIVPARRPRGPRNAGIPRRRDRPGGSAAPERR